MPSHDHSKSKTTHFHVHDSTVSGGQWDAHMKKGQKNEANQGHFVDIQTAAVLLSFLKYDPNDPKNH